METIPKNEKRVEVIVPQDRLIYAKKEIEEKEQQQPHNYRDFLTFASITVLGLGFI